jgi:hypothetical protein
MKKIKMLIAIVYISISYTTVAQSIEFRPIAVYTFRERFPISTGDVTIQDGGTYGGEVAFVANGKMDVNFTYLIQPTTLDIRRFPSFLGDYGNKANISFYQLGVNRNHLLPGNDKVIPYTGIKMGVGYLNLESDKYYDVTRFTIGLNLGVKIMLSERVGLNMLGMLQTPVSGFGLAVTAGSGGVSTGISTYSYVFQFSLGGGLVFKLK